MKNTPSASPKSIDLYQRLAILAVVGIASASCPSNTAQAKSPIPLCKNLKGHKSPDNGTWLDGNEPAEVICAVDGDTFDVALKNHNNETMRIRLWGADCPESSFNNKCMRNGKSNCAEQVKEGKKVSDRVRNILGNGKVILEPPYRNNGNRKLAYIRLENGIDLGRKLISSCLCEEGYSHKRKKDYQGAAKKCR